MVLIGVPDVDVSHKHKTSSQTNKIGGTSDWPDQEGLASPKCMLCGECQSLIVQLYCPLEYSSYHRTLYVFACPNPPCWNMVKSWTVYRCQTLDKSSNQPPQQSVACSTDGASHSSASDWGTDADNWGDDANDWGTDANDWGDDDKNLSMDANNWEDNTKDMGDDTNEQGDGCDKLSGVLEGLEDSSLSLVTSPASQYDGSCEKQVGETKDTSGDCCSGIEQMSLNETTECPSLHHDDLSTHEDSSVIKENMPAVSDEEKSRILKSFSTTPAGIGEHRLLKAYYINVFEEPDCLIEDKHHVTKLFKDYQKREGFNADDFMETDSSRGGEKYERTVLIHKDVMFHKFMKRIALCPEQCIRYDWDGEPLYNCVPNVDVPSQCTHCNGETVFELQLTPALVNHLRFDVQGKENKSKGGVVEFGTVIIYTCKQNCWNDEDMFRTENKMVLADPDQHLFK